MGLFRDLSTAMVPPSIRFYQAYGIYPSEFRQKMLDDPILSNLLAYGVDVRENFITIPVTHVLPYIQNFLTALSTEPGIEPQEGLYTRQVVYSWVDPICETRGAILEFINTGKAVVGISAANDIILQHRSCAEVGYSLLKVIGRKGYLQSAEIAASITRTTGVK